MRMYLDACAYERCRYNHFNSCQQDKQIGECPMTFDNGESPVGERLIGEEQDSRFSYLCEIYSENSRKYKEIYDKF